MTEPQNMDLTIPTVGVPEVTSPLNLSNMTGDKIADYTESRTKVLFDVDGASGNAFEAAGPRAKIFFRGEEVSAGIVTCGGLCPGMNNVIRALVMQLWYSYGARRILGFRYGFRGLTPDSPERPEVLTPDDIKDIHHQGGTVLGSSRGHQRPEVMVDTLQKLKINVLFTIGGDGTMRGAQALYEEIQRRDAKISLIGVPKTIDNDLPFIERTFGFDSAVAIANEAIKAAHVESIGAPYGIGLVRLMGRNSGFIAASATLACREVNLVLVPELPFDLHGPGGVLELTRARLASRGHSVVVVAEGAGQYLLETHDRHDASGNKKLGDIGVFMKEAFKKEFKSLGVNVKYINPSYMIRAAPANAGDAIYCGRLAEDAVHAAMAGKTGMVVGIWNNHMTHVPLTAVTSGKKNISLDSAFWRSTVETTGQPQLLTNPS